MPVVYKVLGQSAPSATTATTLYTVPSATSAVVSTLTVCNRDTSGGTYRIAVRPGGAALANQHYLAYDTALPASSTSARMDRGRVMRAAATRPEPRRRPTLRTETGMRSARGPSPA